MEQMQQPQPRNRDDSTIYTSSLSQIERDRAEALRNIETLKFQGKGEDDLTVRGFRYKLEELDAMEKETRESMGGKPEEVE